MTNEIFFAGGFLFNSKTNSVLLHKRDSKTKFNPDKWGFFGGTCENDESPTGTFIREIKEELNIDISKDKIIPLCCYLNEEFNTYRHIFYVESDLKKDEMKLGEGADFEWIPVKKVFDYELTEKTIRDLKSFLQRRNNKNINCIIIHGCPSDAEKAMNPETRTYDKHWIPWVKEKLFEKGIKTETPLMPEPWQPDYEKFKQEFDKCNVNEDTVLVGHSCGCAFLVRWLGETKQRSAKLILVAPWKIPDEGDKAREAFYKYPIDKKIKDRIQKIVMFTADDEEEDGKRSLEIYHQALDGEVIELKGHGHYTMSDMGTIEFPELLKVVLEN